MQRSEDWVLDPGPDGVRLAQERHERFINDDPFPLIPPSLLGSAAFLEYVRVTAMVHPFRGWNPEARSPDIDLVKPASYEMRPGKSFFIFNEEGDLVQQDLTNLEGNHFIRLPPNSITFVSTEETFRLPNYIAVRFNLRIKHVHRGLLLGTGPLIDPGYNKPILIPLHNLTDADHFIALNEGLIWVEFTKTYPSPQQNPALYSRFGKPKLPNHTKKDLRNFLFAASAGAPIRSSILDIKRSTNEAQQKVTSFDQRIRNYGIIGVITLLIAVAGLLYPTLSIMQSADADIDRTREELQRLSQEVKLLNQRVTDVRNEAQAENDPQNAGGAD